MPIRKRPVETPPWEERTTTRVIEVPTDRVNAVMPVGRPGEIIPGYGNVGTEDLVAARLKLLQGMSPECKPDAGSHPQGHWFHTSEGITIGTEVPVVSLGVKKTVEVWPPRKTRQEGEGILARSSDGVNWDEGSANLEIVIEHMDGKREVWRTRANVAQSGFTQFRNGGAPIAGYTYRMALWLPSLPTYPVNLYAASKTATTGVLDLHGRIRSRVMGGTPFFAQQYLMRAQIKKGSGNIQWFVPQFANLPDLTDKALIEELQHRSEMIYRANVVAADELEENANGGRRRGGDQY